MIPSPAQWVRGSSIATAVAYVTAAAWIRSLAWELPYTMAVTIKKKKKKKKRKEGERKKERKREEGRKKISFDSMHSPIPFPPDATTLRLYGISF